MWSMAFPSVEWIALCCIVLAAVVDSKHYENPANDLVEIINKNRTAHKLPGLSNSPGLGCIALQYAEECQGNCTSNNVINCKPLVDDFTEVFAPNCGVELPTFATISGYIIGCHHKHLMPSEAFSQVLVGDKKSLSLVRNKSHTEVGVGVGVGVGDFGARKHKGPYLWCILFSDGQANATLVLDDLGKGMKQKKGCYSGTTDPCSRGNRKNEAASFMNIWTILLLYLCFF